MFVQHFCRFLARFKNAIANYPRLAQLVNKFSQSFQEWHSAITVRQEAFGKDSFDSLPPSSRDILLSSIKGKVDKLTIILAREEGKLLEGREKTSRVGSTDLQPGVDALYITYEGPGRLRDKGQRHDNDFEDINEIRIAPTHMELLCRLPPFLPANVFGAPHPAPHSSMQRLLDIQFRLLREELTCVLSVSHAAES